MNHQGLFNNCRYADNTGFWDWQVASMVLIKTLLLFKVSNSHNLIILGENRENWWSCMRVFSEQKA